MRMAIVTVLALAAVAGVLSLQPSLRQKAEKTLFGEKRQPSHQLAVTRDPAEDSTTEEPTAAPRTAPQSDPEDSAGEGDVTCSEEAPSEPTAPGAETAANPTEESAGAG